MSLQIHQGTFGSATVESNSLTANLLKYPEIQSKITDLYPQYNITNILHKLGRYAKDVEIGDVKYRWPVMGRKTDPSVVDIGFVGAATAGLNFQTFTVDFDPTRMYLHPYDVVRFPNGQNGWVVSISGATVTFKLQTGDASAFVDLSGTNISGKTLGKIGTMFPEASNKGFGNIKYPDWYENYLGIERESFDITGSALTDVLWIESGGQRLWFFKAEKDWMDEIYYRKEVNNWFGRKTVDANGNVAQFDIAGNGKPLFHGDGLEQQIFPGNIDTYTGTLLEEQLLEFATMLLYNCGGDQPTYLVLTGRAGQLAWTKAMRNYYVQNGAVMWAVDAQSRLNMVKLGASYTEYHALDAKFILAHHVILDDPNIFGNDMVVSSAGSYPRKSYDMFFLDVSMIGAQSNLEIAVKSAGGINRGHIVKYIPGMVDPFDPKAMRAATSDDSFRIEYLCESGLVLRNPMSCGILKYA